MAVLLLDLESDRSRVQRPARVLQMLAVDTDLRLRDQRRLVLTVRKLQFESNDYCQHH